MEAVEKGLASIETKLDVALAAQAKYKGFWGGILMVVSALWYVVTQFGGHISSSFKGTP